MTVQDHTRLRVLWGLWGLVARVTARITSILSEHKHKSRPTAVAALYRDWIGPDCAWCGSTEALEVHHIVPQSRGGTDDPANLVTLCGSRDGNRSYGCHCVVGHGRNWNQEIKNLRTIIVLRRQSLP